MEDSRMAGSGGGVSIFMYSEVESHQFSSGTQNPLPNHLPPEAKRMEGPPSRPTGAGKSNSLVAAMGDPLKRAGGRVGVLTYITRNNAICHYKAGGSHVNL